MNRMISLVSRVLFLGSFALGILAMWEKLANRMAMTVLRGAAQPSRLLELAAICLLFVIALQLREIKTALNAR